MFIRAKLPCLAAVTVALLSGCSTLGMKATPFYSGEYKEPAEKRVNLWPAFYYREPVVSVLWPVTQFDRGSGSGHVFPVFWGEDYFVVFPEVWWFEDGKGVLPVFWGDDHLVVFPVVWWMDKTKAVFPVWVRSKSGKRHDTWALWPVFRWKQWGDDRGLHVWPLAGAYKDGDKRYKFALWPLYHDWRDGDDSLTLTPLWSARRQGDTRWDMLFPLYYRSIDPSTQKSRFLTPLIGRTQTGEQTRWILSSLASSAAWGEDEKDLWMLAPMTHFRWGGDTVRSHVVPLYYYDRNDNLILTPVFSRHTDNGGGWVNLLAVAAHYSYLRDGRKTLSLLPPVSSVSWGNEQFKSRLFPLWTYESRKGSAENIRETDFSLLWRLAHYEREDDDKALDIFPGITWDSKADGYRQFSFLWRLFRIERTQDGDRNLDVMFLPLMRNDDKSDDS